MFKYVFVLLFFALEAGPIFCRSYKDKLSCENNTDCRYDANDSECKAK